MFNVEDIRKFITKGENMSYNGDFANIAQFNAWRAQVINYLGYELGAHDAYTQSFRDSVFKNHRRDILTAITVLHTIIEDYHEGRLKVRNKSMNSFSDPMASIRIICDRFNKVARELRVDHNGREKLVINNEYDVQVLFRALLQLFFNDIRSEEYTPSYAGKNTRMDFLLKNEQIVIEVKKTRQGLGAREVGTQLIEDIARYSTHPDCKVLVCFVYDPEAYITNPRGLENDLNKVNANGLSVVVFVRPL